MKKIPLGISSYQKIYDKGCLFVDKTKEIKYVIDNFDFAFFSRPRRFGKSITLDTIATLFSKGVDPYFKDTYIAGNNDDGNPLWNEPIYPVVRLDFSGYDTDSIELFREDFASQLNDYEKEYELKLTPCKGKISKTFKAFHQKFAKKFPKGYVILVDEYDYPLNAFINDKENFELFRKELRSFYAKIKESTICAAIRFMLVTGITRFKDVSIFSAGSNIIDISYDANIASIVGYTREDIQKYFKEYIDIAIEKQHNCSVSSIDSNTYQLYKNSLLDELALNYDNICYDEFGEQSVYSTWSVNNFFQDVANKSQVEFNDYWFANGGLPTILVNYLQKHLIDLSAFNKKKILVSKETFTNPTTLQSMDLNVLMAQTGYLSLVKGNNIRKKCELTIPNLELRKALSSLTLSNLYGSYFDEVSSDLEDYLITADPKQIFDKFNEILAKVPRANQAFNLDDEYIVKTIIQMFVLGADINCYREVYESKGRPDLVIELNNRIIVIEFKYVTNSKEVDDKLTEAVAQIKDRDYGQSFDCNKTRLKMAVVYDANEKKLVAFKEC